MARTIKQQLSQLALAMGMVVMAGNVMAQATDTESVNATATVIKPLVLTVVGGLKFGKFVAGTGGGTVVIAADGDRSKSGSVVLFDQTSDEQEASFSVAGENLATYTITLPSTTTLNGPSEATMSVGSFVTNKTEPLNKGTLDGSGSDTFTVGATLTVGANQTTGAYTGSFDVTVTYE